jgi:hypothetical protein
LGLGAVVGLMLADRLLGEFDAVWLKSSDGDR